jgi:hypothetical protein
VAAVGAAATAGVLSVGVALAPAPASGIALAAAADQPEADWTFLVYGVLDTENVADVLSQDLASLTGLPDADNVNVVALVDMPEKDEPGYPDQPLPGLASFTTTKLLVLDDGRWNEVRDLGEAAMDDPAVLASFIDEAVDRFPAEKYAITLMDHGGGRYGGYWDTGEGGDHNLTIPKMRTGLLQGIQQSDIGRFDVLFHAACLMSNYETASALAPTAAYMAGSEEIMFANPLYAGAMLPLAADADGQTLAEALVDGYGTYLDGLAQEPGGQEIRDLAAMSVIDSDAMSRLDAAMQSFSDTAVAHMDDIAVPVARARGSALEFVVGLTSDQSPWDLVDLGDFLRHLTDVPDEVAVARDAAFAALQNVVSHQLLGTGTQQATGLNVYLPKAENAAYAADYFEPGVAPAGWSAFVQAFLEASAGQAGQGGVEPGAVQFTSDEATVLQADQSGVKIAGQLAGDSSQVTDSETQVLTTIGGRDAALGVVLPAYVDAGLQGQVQGVWDYSLTVLTDGQKEVPATSIYQGQSGGLVGTLFAQYTSPDGDISDVAFRLLLSSAGDISSIQVVDVSNGGQSAGGLTLEVGGRITPYVYFREADGFARELSAQSIAVTDQLSVAFSRLPSDTPFQMGVLVSDAAGNFDSAFVNERVR